MLKIFPVIPTLFGDDNSLNLEAQREVTRWALGIGAHGVVFPGVASEYNFLLPMNEADSLRWLPRRSTDPFPSLAVPVRRLPTRSSPRAGRLWTTTLIIRSAPRGLGQTWMPSADSLPRSRQPPEANHSGASA